MKKVYIYFLGTPFKTGTVIRFLTKNKYNHVAFSFNPDGQNLYSYARYRFNEPLLSGFCFENTDRYSRDLEHTYIKICELDVSDEQYTRIENKIAEYVEAMPASQYNFFSILTYPFNRPVKMEYVHTCISFVSEVLEVNKGGKIGGLERLLDDNIIFEATLKEFNSALTSSEIDFFEKRSRRLIFTESAKSLGRLTSKFIHTYIF